MYVLSENVLAKVNLDLDSGYKILISNFISIDNNLKYTGGY